MLFHKFIELLPHFGFQTKALASQKSTVEKALADAGWASLSADSFVLQLPLSLAQHLDEELKSTDFSFGRFQVQSQTDTHKIYQVSLNWLSYDHIVSIVQFLMSGLVHGFEIQNQVYVFNSMITAQCSLVSQDHPDPAQDLQALLPEIHKHNDDAILINYAGKLCLEMGDYQKAAAYFADAAKACDNYAEPYSNLGILMWKVGQKERAFDLFCQALIRNPLNVDVQDNFIQSGIELGEVEKMADALKQTETLCPDYSGLLYLTALLCHKVGNQQECQLLLQKLLSREPNDERALQLLKELN